jgi:hypothetical protein
VIFEANEQALAGRIELRREVSEAGWGAILAVQARYERRVRNALSVPIVARVSGLTTGLSAELARSVSSRTLLLGTLALASYSANSSFPAPNTLGSIYRTYILGEYDLSARKAIPWLGAVGARWKASAKTLVWALLSSERVAPTDKFGPTGLGPNGSRSVVSVIAGVTLK